MCQLLLRDRVCVNYDTTLKNCEMYSLAELVLCVINLVLNFVIINKLLLQSDFTTSAFCCDLPQDPSCRSSAWAVTHIPVD